MLEKLKEFFKRLMSFFKKEIADPALLKRNIIIGVASFCCLFILVFAIAILNGTFLSADGKLIREGDKLMYAGSYKEAEEAYLLNYGKNEKLDLKLDNKLKNLYTSWVNKKIKAETFDEDALYAIQKLIKADPQNKELNFYTEAVIRLRMGDYDGAEKISLELVDMVESEKSKEEYYDFYAHINLEKSGKKKLAEIYYEIYKNTDNERYLKKYNELLPNAPRFSHENGEYNAYFSLVMDTESDDCQIFYTVDGSAPDTKAGYSTYLYKNNVDMSYFANGTEVMIRSISVDKDGLQSYESVAEYSFDIPYYPVESIEISRDNVTLVEDELVSLNIIIYPANATNQNIVWTSSNENYAVVDEFGFVTAVHYTDNENKKIRNATSFTVTITATVVGENISASCKVTVSPDKTRPSSSIVRATKIIDFNISESYALNPEVVAWIYMNPHLKVPFLLNSPVLQTIDNSFYLNHDINKEESENGTLFADIFSNMQTIGKNTVIHGNANEIILPDDHPLSPNYIAPEALPENEPKKEIPPASSEATEETLPYIYEGDALFAAIPTLNIHPYWYYDANNHFIYLSTAKASYVFQLFSWYNASADFIDYGRNAFADGEDFVAFATDLQLRNKMPNLKENEFTEQDSLLTLIAYQDGLPSVIVHARLVKYRALAGDAIPVLDFVPITELPQTEDEEEVKYPEYDLIPIPEEWEDMDNDWWDVYADNPDVMGDKIDTEDSESYEAFDENPIADEDLEESPITDENTDTNTNEKIDVNIDENTDENSNDTDEG